MLFKSIDFLHIDTEPSNKVSRYSILNLLLIFVSFPSSSSSAVVTGGRGGGGKRGINKPTKRRRREAKIHRSSSSARTPDSEACSQLASSHTLTDRLCLPTYIVLPYGAHAYRYAAAGGRTYCYRGHRADGEGSKGGWMLLWKTK